MQSKLFAISHKRYHPRERDKLLVVQSRSPYLLRNYSLITNRNRLTRDTDVPGVDREKSDSCFQNGRSQAQFDPTSSTTSSLEYEPMTKSFTRSSYLDRSFRSSVHCPMDSEKLRNDTDARESCFPFWDQFPTLEVITRCQWRNYDTQN